MCFPIRQNASEGFKFGLKKIKNVLNWATQTANTQPPAARFRKDMTQKDIHSLVGKKIKNTGRNTRLNKTFGYFEIKFKKKSTREERRKQLFPPWQLDPPRDCFPPLWWTPSVSSRGDLTLREDVVCSCVKARRGGGSRREESTVWKL